MSRLFEPITINNLRLKNRIVMPPMATEKSGDGNVTQKLCDYYAERAEKSGMGLIITEHSYVDAQGKVTRGQMAIDENADMDGLKRLADTIHSCGRGEVKAFTQINHAGSTADPAVTGKRVVGVSAVAHPKYNFAMPEELTVEEIHKLVGQYADAARRSKTAGFDGVEIHSAHGYLLNQFYSPLTNKRTDEYGGSTVRDRVRMHIEVIKAVREAVGKDFPVAIRLGGCDYMEGGSTVEDCAEACALFEQAGVDLLDISGGMIGYTLPDRKEAGFFRDMTPLVMKNRHVPVILTGGVTKISEAEELIDGGFADMIGVGRAMLKNPRWDVF